MEVRLATREDVGDIMQFIKEYWKEDHILAKDREFFEWMYVTGERCCFEIAKSHGKICGINGFIPYSKEEPADIGASLWKAIYCEEEPFVGLVLWEEVYQDFSIRHCLGLGLNKRSCRIWQMNGGKTDRMKHFYRLGEKKDYQIAVVHDRANEPIRNREGKFTEFQDENAFLDVISDEWLKQFPVYKDTAYLVHRYFRHPVYKYHCYGIAKGTSDVSSLLFCRFVEQNGSQIMKIIDFIGNPEDFSLIGEPVQKIIDDRQLEYVDLYSYGIREEYLNAAGFRLRTSDVNIIPNYFEPFVQDNVDINIKVPECDLYMFRGDGDMDRPNYRDKESR